MNEFEKLIQQRDYYDEKMGEVLNGNLHLKKNWTHIKTPLTEEQKKKDLFLYKYYEHKYNEVCKLIEEEYKK